MEANRRAKSGGKGGIFVVLAVFAVACLSADVSYCRTITVVGRLASGQGFYGVDTIKILADKVRGLASLVA